jgi:hypothetical protein
MSSDTQSKHKPFPPSGSWSGYYAYGHGGPQHRMNLGLTFSPDGKMWGEGIDDFAPFTIDGIFDATTNQANWTKSYVGKHSVEYHGVYDQRSICGSWTLPMSMGNFCIWPSAMRQREDIETEVEQPMEVILT